MWPPAADVARAPQQLQAQENQNNEPGKLGAGGMADTRDPEPFVNESDKRQSISQAPSFEVRGARARADALSTARAATHVGSRDPSLQLQRPAAQEYLKQRQ